jgi:hypothetical protein
VGTYSVTIAAVNPAAGVNLTTTPFTLTNTVGLPASITPNAGVTPQATNAGTFFAKSLAVTVRDAGNNIVPGVNVAFTAPASGASGKFNNSASTIIVATDAYGVASAAFIANSVVGGPYTVTAGSGPAHAKLSLTNQKGVPATMTVFSGTTPQWSWPNAFDDLSVTVLDASGNPVAGANVLFTAPASGASCTFAPKTTATVTIATNNFGVANAWCIDNGTPSPGAPYQVTAALAGVTTVTFTLTNARAPSSMTAAASSTPQLTLINTAFPSPPAVYVKDAYNNPIPGVSVTFIAPITATGPTGTFTKAPPGLTAVPGITVTTNNSGVAADKFTANGVIGSYTVTAAATGLKTQIFSLLNIGPPAAVIPNPGSTPQTTPLNTLFPNPLSATVEDAKGNPLAGVSVTFSLAYGTTATSPSGVFSNRTGTITQISDSAGNVSVPFTSNGIAGKAGVIAAVTNNINAKAAVFGLTNGGPPTSITINPGSSPQTAPVSTQFAQPLAVTVRDAAGDPVAGVGVMFTAPATGASGKLSSPPPVSYTNGSNIMTVTTNASGVASVTITANGVAGSYKVTATAGTGLNVSFSLTN